MSFARASLRECDDIIDVRTPAEFALDHLPGALNLPALDDGQRHEVGALYARDPFAGRRKGLGLVAANLARMATGHFADKEPGWRPLVYCWRGGMRSGTVVRALRDVGWEAQALPGGYRTYRRWVQRRLAEVPPSLSWRVLCGPTGAGKTLLLGDLARRGVQVIDLEGLANHRGSLFGGMGPQPTQKLFEGRLALLLDELDPRHAVFVEAESRMIGRINVPKPVLAAMHAGSPVVLDATLADRARLTARDYQSFANPDDFAVIVRRLARYVSNAQVDAWLGMHAAGDHERLAADLLARHYDRKYANSLNKHYDLAAAGCTITLDPNDAQARQAAATRLMAAAGTQVC